MTARSNLNTLITVFGGSGFVGRHVVRALARRDFRVRVAVRRPELAGHLQPLGRTGQIHAVQANVRVPASVEAAVRDAVVVINLTGILFERGRQTFDALHDRAAGLIAHAAADIGARLVHMSALGADANSTARYARSKAAGEAAAVAAAPDAVIVRPSVVFGPEDNFFNRFASMARISPVLPLIGGGETRLQPVFVGDVAEVFARAAAGEVRPGTYELGGPETRTFRELMSLVLATIERRRLLLPIPFGVAAPLARVLQFLPTTPLTPDQVELLRSDTVVSETARQEGRTLEGLGIDATAMSAVVPSYLWRFRKTGEFRRRAA